MTDRALPNLGLKGFWALGEDGWNGDHDLNLLKLSVLVQAGAISKVSATPGSPTDGDVHIFDETHPTQANKIAIRDNGAWVYVTPLEGWLVYNRAANYYEKFDGTAWAELATGGGGGSATLAGLTDVDVTTTPPTEGQALVWNNADSKWEPGTVAGGGSGGGAAGPVDVIATHTFDGTSDSFTFSAIPAGYRYLELVLTGHSEAASEDDAPLIRFNGDSGANYANHREFTNPSLTLAEDAASTYLDWARVPGNASPSSAEQAGGSTLKIFNYDNTDFYTDTLGFGSSTSGATTTHRRMMISTSVWLDTSVVTSLELYSYSAANFTAGTKLTLYGYRDSGSSGGGAVITDATTARTAALGDANNYVRFTSGSAVTFTIPAEADVAFPIGTVIEFEQAGAGALTIAGDTGVTLNSRAADFTMAGQYSTGFVKKVDTDTWTLGGDL
ncbi:MAG TPA: DUF2793 domain-containing protein [Rhizobium sp.]|nr:DUF2793 domain-containing protein [Rhizobium sp.]